MTYDSLFEFERQLCQFTGAPFAVATDGATHAIELALRFDHVRYCRFTCWTYISVVQTMLALNIKHDLAAIAWSGEYQFEQTRVWDSARRLQREMYRPGQVQCVSFGPGKPLHLGRVGAILTDDKDLYHWASRARSDGRDLAISPWQQQQNFGLGWHYCPSLELCATGITALQSFYGGITSDKYPDCRDLTLLPK